MTDPALKLGPIEKAEDLLARRFYGVLFSAPQTLLAVKHSFYFNETYGESPRDTAFISLVQSDHWRSEIEAHIADEKRHAAMWRNYLSPRNEMPDEDAKLPFGDFVGFLEASGWFPNQEKIEAHGGLRDFDLMAFFAAIHVIEFQAVRQMIAFRKICRERGEDPLVHLLSEILKDEGRHMRYSKAGLVDLAAKENPRMAPLLLKRAEKAFYALRAGDMRKILAYLKKWDGEKLSGSQRALLWGMGAAISTFSTKVMGPDGKRVVDSRFPLPERTAPSVPTQAEAA
jgi:hypothetical protein